MSRQPEELTGWAAAIVAAFNECESKVPPLYQRYLEERFKKGLGRPKHGEGESAFRSWMAGTSVPNGDELHFVCLALNGALEDLGKPRMLADIPLPDVVIPPSGDGLESPDEGSTQGGYLTSDIRSKAA